MFRTDDTIVAIATPPGRGGIGVVRISGPRSHQVVEALTRHGRPFEPRYATLAEVRGPSGTVDRAVVTVFIAPHSYTGEDVAEISAHGSPVILQGIVVEALRLGARLAEPGEFTFRAYLNGRIDLIQAEAVRDLVEAVTPLQARAAFDQLEGTLTEEIRGIDRALLDLCARLEASLDFPAEGYHFVDESRAADEIAAIAHDAAGLLADARRGGMIRDGVQVVLAGRPNSGKSSLFNRLAGAGRAIVTDTPGTTRDLITERIDIDGVPVTLVDTAGVREHPSDPIEVEGIARATAAHQVAAVVLVVLDGAAPITGDDRALLRRTEGATRLIAVNKSDLPAAWPLDEAGADAIRISALTGWGTDELRRGILSALGGTEVQREIPAVTNVRHRDLLARAHEALLRGRDAAAAELPEEFVLADLNEARALLEEMTGARTPDDLLAVIFASFCIGK